MNTGRTTAALASAVLALGPALAACGGEEAPSGGSGGGVPESASFNDADVDFATEMLPHHAQALMMVDLTTGRDLDPQVTAVAEEIRAAQAPEIEEMTDLLEGWDQPVPETARDHAHAENHGATSSMDDMPGMLSADELDALEAAKGVEFERLWLESMVAHHEGAIAMAGEEVEGGEDPDAIALATQIRDEQQAEISRLDQLLDG